MNAEVPTLEECVTAYLKEPKWDKNSMSYIEESINARFAKAMGFNSAPNWDAVLLSKAEYLLWRHYRDEVIALYKLTDTPLKPDY